jgi:hypothetical protein
MKRIFAALSAAVLLLPLGAGHARADMIPPYPPPPERPPEAQRHDLPVVSIAAGVVAVALTGSLIALRLIRKRNVQ